MRMHYYYALGENGNPRVCSMEEFTELYRDNKRRIVKQENVGKYFVSTVFLGLDHNYSETGPPILWETMVFHPNPDKTETRFKKIELDGYTERCSGNQEQAEAMHERVLAKIKALVQ